MARSILITELPRFVPPMLAKRRAPFDSQEHLFELKWDGTRALAFVDSHGYRLVNRHQADVTDRYPELGFLNDLPAGIVLDGEVVVLRQGKPNFGLLLSRNQARASLKIQSMARTFPATYIVFDLIYHPKNPHYFLFRDKPAILVTSGEHYGAVLNLDFDYRKYLATLAADGMNLTRTFPGAYVEPVGAFKIERNTLAPRAGRLICPWARSETPGYINGGARFDLTRWDDEYFRRLRDFVAKADERGIIVELNLFTPMYEDPQWNYSPMKSSNNVNGIGKVGKHEVYTTDKEPALLEVQEAMVRKIVTELNGFDNLYYEICNEPYFGGVSRGWHDRITDVIVGTEKTLPKKHLISWNVANDYAKVKDSHSAISIINFHYARPAAVTDNYGLNKILGLNETGFKGTGDDYYRKQAWEFLLAGGGLYNNLDYSFCVGHEDGTFSVKAPTPGGGSPNLRRQL